MASLFRAFGILALVAACISAVLGLLSLPPGRLLFALPYFFFGLAIGLGVVGGVCLLAARGTRVSRSRENRVDRETGSAEEARTRAASVVSAQQEGDIADLDVRIVRLEPMTVASARAVSESPEREAWQKLRAWAEPRGLFEDLEKHPVFGFNNPNPSPERKDYGYEVWIRVDPGAEPEGEVELKDFAGGLYAVTRCKLVDDPRGNVMEVWKQLWDWVQAGEYEWRRTHELEKHMDPRVSMEDLVLELYLPIEG